MHQYLVMPQCTYVGSFVYHIGNPYTGCSFLAFTTFDSHLIINPIQPAAEWERLNEAGIICARITFQFLCHGYILY